MEVTSSMSLTSKQIDELDISAVLNQYVYGDYHNEEFIGKSLKEIVKMSPEGSKIRENLACFSDDVLADIYLVSESSTDGAISMDELVACSFVDKNGNFYVAYRGTGDGKWVDNGVAMANDNSLMQIRAQEYFDHVIDNAIDYVNDNLKTSDGNKIQYNGNLIVTGHSKGGNSAQYVALTSKYADMISSVYSLDGQGFSNSAITKIINERGSDFYNAQIDKMYSINGHNDYVHELGNVIIKPENTILIQSTAGDGFAEWHVLEGLLNGEGKIAFKIEDGVIVSVEQGAFGKLAAELSAKIMELGDEELEDCTISIMSILEMIMGDGAENSLVGTGDVATAGLEEYAGLLQHGLPIIVNTLIESENTIEVLKLLGISEDIQVLVNEVQIYAQSKNISDFYGYICEDPLRLIEVYTSLDLSKKMVNEAAIKVLAASTVAKLLISAVFPTFSAMLNVVAAACIICLVANHIVKNWDTICEKAELIADYVKDEIVKFYNEAKQAVQNGMNIWLGSVCTTAEKYITKGARVVNKFIDGAADFWDSFKEKAIDSVKTLLFVANPLIYIIASKVYKANKEPVRINIPRIRDCVDRMNNLARRVANIDSRLDNLYWRLAQNNIEKEEGIFTSLANMYNLFRADLNVDEGAAIKRKARALSDLYDGYESTEKWVMDNVPQKI